MCYNVFGSVCVSTSWLYACANFDIPMQSASRKIVTFVIYFAGLLFLDALLQDIVHDFGKRIDDEGRKKVCAEFKVPKNVQLPDLRHRIYEYILLSELEKTGQNTNDEIGMQHVIRMVKTRLNFDIISS